MPEPLIEQGSELILPCSDPAVTIRKGWRRYLVGWDVGQAKDPSAFAIIRDECVPFWGEAGQELGKRQRTVVRAEYLPPMSYADLATVAFNVMHDRALRDRSHLVIDSGGVGRAFVDLVQDKGQPAIRAALQGGESENVHKERGITYHNLGKAKVLGAVNSALHTGDLVLGNFPNRDRLQIELESFEIEVTQAGRVKIDGGTDFSHNDVAIAVALAFWLSDHRSVSAYFGTARLEGMY